MMHTTTTTMMLALAMAMPVAAQDTSITIMNKDCTVKVDGKRLPAAEEKKACEQMTATTGRLRSLNWQFGQNQADRYSELLARGMQSRAGIAQERAVSGQLRAAEAIRRDLTERAMVAFTSRPRFGITIDTRPRDTDKWGAYITAVTPGGPADKAGIRSGDIITKLAGKGVTAQGDEPPGVRLIAMIGELEPNKSVDVQLRRGNDTKSVKVTPSNDDTFFAGPMIADSIRRVFSFEAAPTGVMTRGRSMEPAIAEIVRRNGEPLTSPSYQFSISSVNIGGPLAALEMASLNAGLGAYFGASEGVLIINTGEKQELGLLPGDVVTAVDGRKVSSPSQLARILRTYEKGEEYKLQVMRQKRGETVSGKMP
jgi:S1-C subfamily serine protease